MVYLKIILASTRAGRKGPPIASWVMNRANTRKEFDTELLDLAAINLPFLDEPNHPRLKKYEKIHTKNWSNKIESADAFIIVTSEYNYGYPAPLKNAFDFLFHEWAYKPVAFVSYGGIAGGTRAVQLFKPVVTYLKMMPLPEAVPIPFFIRQIDKDGNFEPTEEQESALKTLFDELHKWSINFQSLRQK